MKFQKNSNYTTIAVYAFAVIAASLLFLELLRNVGNVFGWLTSLVRYVIPVVYGAVIAFLLNPLMRSLEERILPKVDKGRLSRRARRRIALAITYFVAIVLVSIFLSIVLPQVLVSLNGLIAMLQDLLSGFNFNIFVHESAAVQMILQFVEANFGREAHDIVEQSIVEGIQSLYAFAQEKVMSVDNLFETVMANISSLFSFVGGAVNSVFVLINGLINVVLGIIISIYFLSDRERLFAQLNKIIRAVFPPRVSDLLYEVAAESNRILSGFVIGKVIDSVIIGIICFIGMCFICPAYSVLIALIIGVTNIIPYFGPFIGAIPSFFLVLISGPSGPIQSVIFLVFVLVLQQFDGNILGPKILGDSTGLSALWVVFSIMLFSGMFGILGMFIGVPLFAIIYYLLKRIVAFLLRKKGASDKTRDYASDRNPLI